MAKVLFGTPTYHRDEFHTVHMLLDNGVNPEDIIIGTQDAEDHENALKLGVGTVLLDESIHNAAGNRNQILSFAEKAGADYLLMMDDDVTGVPSGCKFSFTEMVKKSVEIMRDRRMALMEWDCHGMNSDNSMPPLWLGWTYGAGTSMLNIDGMSGFRYDETFNVCEDMELSLRLLTSGRTIGYCTGLKVTIVPSGFNKKPSDFDGEPCGGCTRFYRDGVTIPNTMLRLVDMYGHFGYVVRDDSNKARRTMWFWSPTSFEEVSGLD